MPESRESNGLDRTRTREPEELQTARVCLLIPTHALPPLDYRIPGRLSRTLRTGSFVVAPLSGRSRFGIVISTGENGERATESLRSVAEDISLPQEIVRLCEWAAARSAISLAAALRAALPPGVETDRYRVVHPKHGWKWKEGEFAGRLTLRRALGEESFKNAESEGRVSLSPRLPKPRAEEWAIIEDRENPDFGRAHRQRRLFEVLHERGGESLVSTLLPEAEASRSSLRALVERGAASLESRPSMNAISVANGVNAAKVVNVSSSEDSENAVDFGSGISDGVSVALSSTGPTLWRTPSREFSGVVAEMARAVVGAGLRLLVLCPEIRRVNDLVESLKRSLPGGTRIAAYHGEVGRERAEVWRLAGRGEVDVLVGSRAAALVPLEGIGGLCVVDEPNESHRARPGYEGLPIHIREVAVERAKLEDLPALFLSPSPSLRLFAAEEMREIPARKSRDWPSVSLVDMRGSGATFSSTLVSACGEALDSGESVGVVVDRLGYATSVSCGRCGSVKGCPNCDIPLTLHERGLTLLCARCGYREEYEPVCKECGSSRPVTTGLAVERVREELSEVLDLRVGLLTAGQRDSEDSRMVVGTARPMLARDWDVVILPDADSLLTGGWMGSAERAFRVFYGAAESARSFLLAQTRNPEHYALRAALRDDYRAFAAAEIPRLKRLGYPPFTHLVSLALRGREEDVRYAVKSRLIPALNADDDIEVSEPVPAAGRKGSGASEWRVLLRSSDRASAARAGNVAARLTAARGKDLHIRVDIDPEEV